MIHYHCGTRKNAVMRSCRANTSTSCATVLPTIPTFIVLTFLSWKSCGHNEKPIDWQLWRTFKNDNLPLTNGPENMRAQETHKKPRAHGLPTAEAIESLCASVIALSLAIFLGEGP